MSLYFAYGSNIDHGQMRRRCPSARGLGPAELADWELRFTGWSRGWSGAVADIAPLSGAVTPGLVYELPYAELVGRLDAFEGCPAVYRRVRLNVAQRGGQGARCWVYTKGGAGRLGVPSARYFSAIWHGYERAGLARQPLIDALCGEAMAALRNPLCAQEKPRSSKSR